MKTCLPSIAPMQLLEFHLSKNSWAINNHFYYVLGTCIKIMCIMCVRIFSMSFFKDNLEMIVDEEDETQTGHVKSTKQQLETERKQLNDSNFRKYGK